MSTFFSLKTLINLYRLLRQREITTKLATVLSLIRPDIDGDIYNNQPNLKRFLTRALKQHRGKICLDRSGDVQLFYKPPLHDTSSGHRYSTDMPNNHNKSEASCVYIRVRIEDRVWNLNEDETLELIQGIYNSISTNSYQEKETQNFYEDDWFHASSDRTDATGEVLHKEMHKQLTQMREECRRLRAKSVGLADKLEKYQCRIDVAEQEERRLRKRATNINYNTVINHPMQLSTLTTRPRKLTPELTVPSETSAGVSTRVERVSLPFRNERGVPSRRGTSLPKIRRRRDNTQLGEPGQMIDGKMEYSNNSTPSPGLIQGAILSPF